MGGLLNTLFKLTMVVAAFAVSLASTAAAAEKKYIPEQPGAAPFSQGVIVGDTLYLSGMLGLDPKTGQAPADPKVEIKIVMDAVKQTLERAGYTMNDLVSVQIFCTDLALYDAFNELYRTYFTGRFPARAFIGTDKLLRGARFEVMGIAAKSK
jgi:2-iminobutanoate/2-iminopropanoate deaminase